MRKSKVESLGGLQVLVRLPRAPNNHTSIRTNSLATPKRGDERNRTEPESLRQPNSLSLADLRALSKIDQGWIKTETSRKEKTRQAWLSLPGFPL